jgi:thymidylate synthase (FAD)
LKTSDISVELIGHYGSDWDVCNAARVSFHKNADEYSRSDNEKLIRYLAKNGHTSPFNHCFLSFRVKAPIFVSRQLVKHKFLPWNEVSRRYVDDEPEFYVPKEWRQRAENVKQGSGEVFDYWGNHAFFNATEYNTSCGLKAYQALLDDGVCPEMARMVLPLNTFTEWVWSGTLGAWLDMLKLRLDEHTQYETRFTAQLISYYVEKHFPVSYEAHIAL